MHARRMLRRLGVLLAAAAISVGLLWAGPGTALAGSMMGSKTGDLNLDGTANSIDALLVLYHSAGLTKPPKADWWYAAADVSCDKVVNSLDASLILQHDAGLIELRP